MNQQTLTLRNFIILGLTLILSACSSKPRLVTASTPLVMESTQSISGTKIPKNYWFQLDQPFTSELNHPEYKIVLKPPYVSAMGNECRELLITGHYQSSVRVACSHTNTLSEQHEWYLMPALDSTSSNISL